MRPLCLCLVAAALLLASGGARPTEALSDVEPVTAALQPLQGFWHYAIQQAGEPTRLVWAALPAERTGGAGAAAVKYAVQRWTSDTMPAPGQPGYLDSLLELQQERFIADGTWTAAAANKEAGAGGDSRPFFRVLALASTGQALAATRPYQPALAEESVFVGDGVASGTVGRRLLQAPTLQAAIDEAARSGRIVNVLPATYDGPGNVNLTFPEGADVRLHAAAGPEGTTIDCRNETRAFAFRPTDGKVEVKGFRVVRGNAPVGGAALIEGSSPTLSTCVFEGCQSAAAGAGFGGAVYIEGGTAAPRILSCTFVGNFANNGGALYLKYGGLAVEGCTFDRNVAAPVIGQGGAVYLDRSGPSSFSNTTITRCTAGFSGGAIATAVAGEVRLDNVTVTDNYSSSHSGAFLVWGSTFVVTDSRIERNVAALFGGAVLGQLALFNATRTSISYNEAVYGGGGGVKLMSGVGLFKECRLVGNKAAYGGALEVMIISSRDQLEGAANVPTQLSVNDTVIEGNVAKDKGAGFHIESADLAVFLRTTIANNVAAVRGGGGWCGNNTAPAPIEMYLTKFSGNAAATGGGLYAHGGCRVNVLMGSSFEMNSASEYGAGIAVGDGAALNVSQSTFAWNGATRGRRLPPIAGGAIHVGVEAFQASTSEGDAPKVPASSLSAASNATAAQLAVPQPAYGTVSLSSVSFTQNRASDRGGALHVAAGSVDMQKVEFSRNTAEDKARKEGAGGAIALSERCSSLEGAAAVDCAPVSASLSEVRCTSNSAYTAGGALSYEGRHPASALQVSRSEFSSNRVGASRLAPGVGGALYLGRPNATLEWSLIADNSAFYGGGLYVAADLSQGMGLQGMNFSWNSAQMGQNAFWLRSESPQQALACGMCLGWQTASLATEMLRMDFDGAAPAGVQTNRPFPPFSVRLLDYYNNTMRTERGTCVVADTSNSAVLSTKGSRETAVNGSADFTQLQLRGTIGQRYDLTVTFEPAASAIFANASQPAQLALPVVVELCQPGFMPNPAGDECLMCAAGTYNLDGTECLPCPKGAFCPGGAELLALANYWRSANNTASFYSCKVAGVCEAGPRTGDAACVAGQQGPLCDVCEDGWFKFSGICRECNANGQAKAMLALGLLAIVLLVFGLFARDWSWGPPGPGIMTKVKIFLTHFQMLALFRDYDVVWPGATDAALGWFEVANVGLSMLAPECLLGGYSFYTLYIFQMALPFVCVAFCVGTYHAADLALRRLDPAAAQRSRLARARSAVASAEPGGSGCGSISALPPPSRAVVWLEGLKLRCWKNTFWFVTLLYPRCAMTALQLFGWQTLDTGTFLKADFSIMVKRLGGRFVSTYVKYLVPGAMLLGVYALLIPGFWVVAVYMNRNNLEDPAVLAKYGFLYTNYTPRLPYWETTEMLRKFAIAFVPVFIPSNPEGSFQAAAAQVVLLVYILLTIKLWPFAVGEDNWLQLASMTVLWLLLLSAGINKWAVLSDSGSRALAGAQLALSSGVGFLLLFAIVRSGLGIARQLTRKYTAGRKAAAEAALEEADVADELEAAPGGGKRDSAKRGSSQLSSLFDKNKRASMGSCFGDGDVGGGEITAARPEGSGKGGPAGTSITVLAGPQLPAQEGMLPPATDVAPAPGLLQRQLSSLTRRAAADDRELQLAVEGSPQASGPSIPGQPGRRLDKDGSRQGSSGKERP